KRGSHIHQSDLPMIHPHDVIEWLETGSDGLRDGWNHPHGSDGPCGTATGPWRGRERDRKPGLRPAAED
ncbi:hypothetical protein BDDG_13192, partial [Blastomyces dermatitidis ATCC 18188]